MPPNDIQEPAGNEPEPGRSPSPLLHAVHARQGVISGRIVTVLGISIALAVAAMVAAYMLS